MRKYIRVLIFEDHQQHLQHLIDMLTASERPFYQVQFTESLEAGIEWLEKDRTDLILLKFPLDGYIRFNALRRLKRACPKLPIILISALDDEADAVEAILKGAQDYVIQGQLNATILTRRIGTALARIESERKRLRRSTILGLPTGTHGKSQTEVSMPLCSVCKKARSTKDDWIPLTEYLQKRGDLPLLHGFTPKLCPRCSQKSRANSKSRKS